jgi:hypothetical protein
MVSPAGRVLAGPPSLQNAELESFDVYPTAIPVELYAAVHQSKNRVIASETDISARQKFGASLSENDVPGDHGLSAKLLHT